MTIKFLEKKLFSWVWQKTELTFIPCPICGCENYKIIYSRVDSLDIVSCKSCSFCFVQPQPSQQELNRFYQQGYFSGNHDFHQGENYFESRKQAILSEQITGWNFIQANVELSGKKLLDLGCADGALLVLAQKYGASRVIGVEVSKEASLYGRTHYDLEILEASVDTLSLNDQIFDIVTAFDLIEHVRQPSHLFKEVSRVLCKGGIFIGGCPDMGCFHDWGAEWNGVRRNMEHLSYFDTNTFSKVAQSSGFRVTHIEYRGFPLELKQYNNFSFYQANSFFKKTLEPNIWTYNLWQKIRFKIKNTPHCHELLFILEKK